MSNDRNAPPRQENHATPLRARLSFFKKFSWGVGGFGENIANSAILSLIYPIFNVALGLSPMAIGLGMSISRISDALIDPLIGNFTDQTWTRWGRRRPWMLGGAVLMALFFIMIWFLPAVVPQLPKMVTVHCGGQPSASSPDPARPAQDLKKVAGLKDNRSWFATDRRDLNLNPSQPSDAFQVMLRRAPEGSVAFVVRSCEPNSPVQVSPATLYFTQENWRTPQTVTVQTPVSNMHAGTAPTFTLKILPESDVLYSPFWQRVGIDSVSALKLFGSFAFICLLFYFSFSLFVIPYSGLGIELTDDYQERTDLQIFRLVASFCASLLVGYLYLWSQQIGGWLGSDEVVGARWVGMGIGGLILISTLIPAIFCRERVVQPRKVKSHLSLFKSVRLAASNTSFRMLMGSVFSVFIGLYFSLPFMAYIGIYHNCGGDKMLAAKIGSVSTVIQAVGQFAAMFLISWAGRHVDKKTILFTGLAICMTGYLSSWWLFTPKNPWLQIIPVVVSAWGLCACWAVNGSFAADICDEDELKTGYRREGLYSAVFAFVYKSAIGLVALGSGVLLAFVGIRGQETTLSAETLEAVRLAYLGIPVFFLSAAIISMLFYPLSRSRVEQIQAKLRERRTG
jgi:Na+/melibiose symporter-like transporter